MSAIRWLLASCLLACQLATAHEARPVAVHVQERAGGLYTFEVRVPNSIEPDNRPFLAWPADCALAGLNQLRCAQPLPGREVAIRWPLYNPSVTTLARFTPLQGSTRVVVLPPERTSWAIPAEPTLFAVVRSYLALGVTHILGGLDHLLFVAGLVLLAGGGRRVVLAVSGFTLGHSVTLSLAALGILRIPVPPTEAAIALSILFLAREALQPEGRSLVRRYPLVISALFGLLHGLGFASALGEAGLPEREIAWALLCFNLGVEVGQLAFIAVLLGASTLIARLARKHEVDAAAWRVSPRSAAAYLIGVPAAFWLLQRLPLA